MPDRVPARVLAQHERPFAADKSGLHVLVGFGILQDGRDMDAALVRERVRADDRLVSGDRHPGGLRHRFRKFVKEREVVAVDIGLHGEQDQHLFERRIPRPFPDPVHGGVELEGPGRGGRDRVRRGAPHVVMAVDAERDRHRRNDLFHSGPDLARHQAADGVGEGDQIGTVRDRLPVCQEQKRRIGPGCILGPEPDLDAVIVGVLDHGHRLHEHLLPRPPVLVPDMEVGGRQEDRDHVHPAVEGGVDILLFRPGQGADPGVEPHAAYGPDGLLFARRDRGEPPLDHFEADAVKQPGDLHLLFAGERNAGCLFPVTQRDIAYLNLNRSKIHPTTQNMSSLQRDL